VGDPLDRSATWPYESGKPGRFSYARADHPTGVACERTPQTLTSTLVDDINDYLRRAHPRLEYPYVGLMRVLLATRAGLRNMCAAMSAAP